MPETYLFADDPEPASRPHKDLTAQLLEWLVKHWNRPTITLRTIHRLGPNSLRDKKTILRLTQVLEDQKWLLPNQTWRRDKREWKIARGLPLL